MHRQPEEMDPRAADPSSKRAFQAQFRRWGFPPKLNPVYADGALAARVREMWALGLPQREMLRVLGEEGFEVRERELVKLRGRLGLLLRDPRGDGRGVGERAEVEGGGMDGGTGDGLEVKTDDGSNEVPEDQPEMPKTRTPRRRRRRTRTWAGNPPDPPGPPRFPSETTLDEARLILALDAPAYRALRTTFQRICEESSLVKKTLAGPERWEAAKARLAAEVPLPDARGERGRLALDIICTDVTKRMRDGDRRMSLADAKRVLGVNPDEARGLRAGFHAVLARQAVPVRCKSTAGARWRVLMGEWVAAGAAGWLRGEEGSEEYRERWRALDVLATDVMKRVRDERVRRGKRGGSGDKVRSVGGDTQGVSPGVLVSPAETSVQSPTDSVEDRGPVMSDYGHVLPMPMDLVPNEPIHVSPLPLDPIPSPLLLDGPPDVPLPRLNTTLLPEPPYSPYCLPYPQPALAIYLRPHPSSTYPAGPQLWVATLASRSLRELRAAAAGRFAGAVCVAVEGVLRGEGGECALGIGGDEELGAYIAHLEGGTPTFNVMLAWR